MFMSTGGSFMRRNPYSDMPVVPEFELKSNLVANDRYLPPAQVSGIFGAGGQDTSPDLEWSGFPEQTRSFMLTMFDPDAPTPSGFWHWAVINLPVHLNSLPAGAGESDGTLPEDAVHLPNDAGLHRYLGAAPPPGDPHRYFIVVSALDVAEAGISTDTTPALASFQMLSHSIARATLIPTFGTE
jgi:Raf kinase inhibitor-like YbhB/YbcL family protein